MQIIRLLIGVSILFNVWGGVVPVFAQINSPDDRVRTKNEMKFVIRKPSGEEFFFRNADIAIDASGPISSNTARKFGAFLKKNNITGPSGLPMNNKVVLINLESEGGDLLNGLNLGRLIRRAGIDTIVKTYCDSACSYAFMGGLYRYYDKGSISIHRISVNVSGQLTEIKAKEFVNQIQQESSALATMYLREMGIDERLFFKATKHGAVAATVSRKDAEEWGLSNNGIGPTTSEVFVNKKRKPVFRAKRSGRFDNIFMEFECKKKPQVNIYIHKPTASSPPNEPKYRRLTWGRYGYVRERPSDLYIYFFDTTRGTVWKGERNARFYRKWKVKPESVILEKGDIFSNNSEYVKWSLTYDRFKQGNFGMAKKLTFAVVDERANSLDPTSGIEVLHRFDFRPVQNDFHSFMMVCSESVIVF